MGVGSAAGGIIFGRGARIGPLATYRGMATEFASALPEPAAHGCRPGFPPEPSCNPAEALAWLQSGLVDDGMQAALRCLAEERGDRELLWQLRENPFLRVAAAPPYGYEGDPTVIDFALGVAPLPADTTPLGLAMYRWMAANSVTVAAFRARRRYVAARLDRAADCQPGAAIVGVFGGHGRELSASRAWREGRAAVQLIDFDARVLERAVRDNAAWGTVSARPAPLADLLSGRVPLTDCGLIYAPSVADNLPDNTLAQLLQSLVPALRPYGEIVVPAFTRMPEPGLLEMVSDWEPNTRSLARLRYLVRGIDAAVATIHDEPTLGVAYLHLQRRPRSVPTPVGGVVPSGLVS